MSSTENFDSHPVEQTGKVGGDVGRKLLDASQSSQNGTVELVGRTMASIIHDFENSSIAKFIGANLDTNGKINVDNVKAADISKLLKANEEMLAAFTPFKNQIASKLDTAKEHLKQYG